MRSGKCSISPYAIAYDQLESKMRIYAEILHVKIGSFLGMGISDPDSHVRKKCGSINQKKTVLIWNSLFYAPKL